MASVFLVRVTDGYGDTVDTQLKENSAVDWVALEDDPTAPVQNVTIPDLGSTDVVLGVAHGIVSAKVLRLLQTFEISCRVVPVRINGDAWGVVTFTGECDCMNLERSAYELLDDTGRIMVVNSYRFHASRAPKGPTVFVLPQLRGRKYCTAEFKTACDAAGVRGWRFVDAENPPPGFLVD